MKILYYGEAAVETSETALETMEMALKTDEVALALVRLLHVMLCHANTDFYIWWLKIDLSLYHFCTFDGKFLDQLHHLIGL